MSQKVSKTITDPATVCEETHGGKTGRREFLISGAAAALTAAGSMASAQQRPQNDRIEQNDRLPTQIHQGPYGSNGTKLSPNFASQDLFARYWTPGTLRLARRISYGVKADEIESLKAKSFSEYLEEQLAWESIPDNETHNAITARYPIWKASLKQIWEQSMKWEEVQWAHYYYSAFTNRQLHARMVEFWLDHFSIEMGKATTNATAEYVFTIIHNGALGNFPDLLKAVSKSAAMIKFLDNDFNHKNRMNINHARELLELHTVSSEGGYTEEDINETAKIMTGWRLQWNKLMPQFMHSIFVLANHANGPKTVMGRQFPETGESEFDHLMDYLCGLRQTHDFLCKKMYRFFIGREPGSDELQLFHMKWVEHNGDIRMLLRVVLAQQNVDRSPSLYKRPFHFYVGFFRQFDMKHSTFSWNLLNFAKETGHVPFTWVDPDGFPMDADFWYNSHITRLQHAMRLAAHRVSNLYYNEAVIFPDQTNNESMIHEIDRRLFSSEMPVTEKVWIQRFVRGKNPSGTVRRSLVGIALGSPSYQWY